MVDLNDRISEYKYEHNLRAVDSYPVGVRLSDRMSVQ